MYLMELHNQKGKESQKKIFNRIMKQEATNLRVSFETISSRVKRKSIQAKYILSPLHDLEKDIVSLIICMSKMKRSLRTSDGLRLINDLIKGTDKQKELIEYKIERKIYGVNQSAYGSVGKKYWWGFMKRNRHRIRSKSGKKYAVDRSYWSSYLNFNDMYSHIEDVLVYDSKIATKFDEPVWMDKNGIIVSNEMDGFGMKCTIDINRPDMAIVLDEVGCNLSQEGDSSLGGEKFLAIPGDQAYQSAATKASHFTCLGLTRLDGIALMCVVLLTGKKRDIMVETGIDWSQAVSVNEDVVNGSELAFFRQNFGNEKLFPGGPSCIFKGTEVPCFIKFTDAGGIDGETLTEIFKRLDLLKLYEEDRRQGMIPFALLDGHQSRFHLDFLKYINNDSTRWNLCIGVPYGTAFWQVGDSSEQNGTFKMLLADEKRRLFDERLDSCQQDLHLLRTDIIPLVNKTWRPDFGNVENNRKAIAERGWFPFNRNLLLDGIIRANITSVQIEEERQTGLYPYQRMTGEEQCQTTETINDLGSSELNFAGGGIAEYCANNIMQEIDRQDARKRNMDMKTEGGNVRDRVLGIKKKITAGKLVLEGRRFALDKNVLEHAESEHQKKQKNDRLRKEKVDFDYLKWCHEADQAFFRNQHEKDVTKWKSMKDIKTYIKPLKQKGDKALPSRKGDIIKRYLEWRHRNRRVVDAEIVRDFRRHLEDHENHEDMDTQIEDAHIEVTQEEEGAGLNEEDEDDET